MRFLVIDSSLNKLKVWVFNNALSFELTETLLNNYADAIIPAINNVLAQTDLTLDNLDFVGVVNGPGSYTGLRIGIAVTNALGFALQKKVIAVSRFEALLTTSKFNDDSDILVLLQNMKGGVFVQKFTASFLPQGLPFNLEQSDILPYLLKYDNLHVVGDGTNLIKGFKFTKNINIHYGLADFDLHLVQKLFINKYLSVKELDVITPITALYIKEPKITIKNSCD